MIDRFKVKYNKLIQALTNHRYRIEIFLFAIFIFFFGLTLLINNYKKSKTDTVNNTVFTVETISEKQEIVVRDDWDELLDEPEICKQITREKLITINPEEDNSSIIGYQTNKFGLYIYADVIDYISIAQNLVNSNGGEWGYVLVPYNVRDYDQEKWQAFFDRLKESKLIPILQLYDIETVKAGKIEEQIGDSSKFLASLDWPIEKRFVSVYNEMNDRNFWKGDIDPEGYARILDRTIFRLKELDERFFVMNGAFNASARTGPDHLDMRTYMQRMDKEVPGIFRKLDGWASHPYPQPNFRGSPKATGRDSIYAYDWELKFLNKEFGVTNLPVFITETGWAHAEGENYDSTYLNEQQVASNIKYAYENVWLPDDRVVAVTPFTIRFAPPFDHFSWIDKNGKPYKQYTTIQLMEKQEGKPPQIEYVTETVVECT